METIFSKIIAGEIPCTKIYEDDTVLAFLDINPIQPGHTLVIPKQPSVDARETAPADIAAVMQVAQKIARAQTAALNCDGVNFLMSSGAAAGQEVFHTHLHVIPRYKNDSVSFSVEHGTYREDKAAQVATDIQKFL